MHSVASARSVNPAEIFVGNLSYFCQDQHLFDLFNGYGHVVSVRIVFADNGTRPLMFGFVRMNSAQEAVSMRNLLDNHLFMGRRIKIEHSDSQHKQMLSGAPGRSADGPERGFQVHVSFQSTFDSGSIILPTEIVLRREMIHFGEIVDAVVKQYVTRASMQDGYGFVTFQNESSAIVAIQRGAFLSDQGFVITCTGSRRSNGNPSVRPQPPSNQGRQQGRQQPLDMLAFSGTTGAFSTSTDSSTLQHWSGVPLSGQPAGSFGLPSTIMDRSVDNRQYGSLMRDANDSQDFNRMEDISGLQQLNKPLRTTTGSQHYNMHNNVAGFPASLLEESELFS